MNIETELNIASSAAEDQYLKTQKFESKGEDIPNDIENLSNVCRTCANVTEFVIPIFIDEGLQNNLADKIHKHLPIKVSEDDIFPNVVCYQCASTLLAWHDLVQCCVQADAELRKRLSHLMKKSQPNLNINQNTEPQKGSHSNETKFKNKPESMAQEQTKSNKPDNAAVVSLQPAKSVNCCMAELPETPINGHLQVHTDSFFYCEQCNKPIERQHYVIHMSQHSIPPAKNELKNEYPRRTRINNIESKIQKTENSTTYRSRDIDQVRKSDKEIEISTLDPATGDACENDFSDHSDAEYFCELPKSVFEAIEDSQDTQTCDDAERISHNETDESIDDKNKNNNDEMAHKHASDSQKKAIVRSCPICFKVYTAKSSYFYHLKHSHQSSKEHECDVCGKRFSAKPTLAQHLLIHTNENPYQCRVCEKKFHAKASLYIHEQIHVGQKTFSCTECKKCFRWRAHYERHLKRHEGQKSHLCATCGRGFTVRCDMLRHARTHAAGVHACLHCGLKFAQSRYLKTHVAKKHTN